jgi:hypothetical protein
VTTLRLEKPEAGPGIGDGVGWSRESAGLMQRLRNSVVKGGMHHWKMFLALADRAVESRKLDLLNAPEFAAMSGKDKERIRAASGVARQAQGMRSHR